jgi:hypothetical protein
LAFAGSEICGVEQAAKNNTMSSEEPNLNTRNLLRSLSENHRVSPITTQTGDLEQTARQTCKR